MTREERQRLSRLIDRSIADLLVRKRAMQNAGRKTVRVVITGTDLTTLPLTLKSLRALDCAGYQLRVVFSHSAAQSGLCAALRPDISSFCLIQAAFTPTADTGDTLFLPALSTNSLTKIALGIRDNLATTEVFQALSSKRSVIVTLNPELIHSGDSGFTPPLKAGLHDYIGALRQYGITLAGSVTTEIACEKRLITLNDIRLHRATETLKMGRNTLITPAAQDEIRRQNITVTR